MYLIISPLGAVIGSTSDAQHTPPAGHVLLDEPQGYDPDLAGEWVYADGALVHDQALALARAKSSRIAAIKVEAAAHLATIAWKLERAREREQAGWASLADVAEVLAEREAVRRSSSTAEAAVQALTGLPAVQAFTWSPADVVVPAPRLLTHEQFIRRFTDTEWQAMTEAARGNAAMDAWMRRFSLAGNVNLDDPATVMGVQMLEVAGILAAGRATEILSAPV